MTSSIEIPSIDTAKAYGNEAQVGQAVRASGLDRSEFFITTKCFNDDHGYDSATRALKTSLGQGLVLDDPALTAIAEAHGKTSAQVVLRWHIELGNVVFPKSATPGRLEENIDIFDFSLSAAEMEQIEAVDRGERTGPDPDEF